MKIGKKLTIYSCGILLICVFALTVIAGGQPLKENVCDTCHKDYAAIFPKSHPDMGKGQPCLTCHAPDPATKEATNFSTAVHKVHQDGKAKLECSACHVQ
jgi:hypothetical protein